MTTKTKDGLIVDLDGEKACTRCNQVFPLSHFGARRMKPKDGKIRTQPQCKKCRGRYESKKRGCKANACVVCLEAVREVGEFCLLCQKDFHKNMKKLSAFEWAAKRARKFERERVRKAES
jgi:hypothetical protein